MPNEYFDRFRKHEARPGDLLIAGLGDDNHPVARGCLMPETLGPAMVKADCFRVRLKQEALRHRYVVYALASEMGRRSVGQETRGSTRIRVNLRGVARLPLPIPPILDQDRITAILDRKTTAVDTLIAKKERLVELLAEKRQALVTQAVTKGLDPSVPMKDSGVEWVGEMPAHWRSQPLKRLARNGAKTFTDGDWIESPYVTTTGVRLLQTGNVGIGVFKEQGFRYVSDETFEALRCTEVQPGDVLICRLDGPVGRACLAPELNVRMITSVDNAILKPAADHDGRYIVYMLSIPKYLDWVQGICRVGGGFRFRISRSMLGDFRLPVPPLHEQKAIASHLDRSCRQSLLIEQQISASIERLREYRQALITAAVTGQLDLSGEPV
ncbi:MAG: restriction endonuclease subunit S [Byssovorax sp.]